MQFKQQKSEMNVNSWRLFTSISEQSLNLRINIHARIHTTIMYGSKYSLPEEHENTTSLEGAIENGPKL